MSCQRGVCYIARHDPRAAPALSVFRSFSDGVEQLAYECFHYIIWLTSGSRCVCRFNHRRKSNTIRVAQADKWYNQTNEEMTWPRAT